MRACKGTSKAVLDQIQE